MRALFYEEASSSLPRVPVARLAGHDGAVQVIRFSGEGKYCLTGGYDRTIRLWNPFRLDPDGANSGMASDIIRRLPSNDVSIPYEEIPAALPIQTYSAGYTHPISSLIGTESATTHVLLAASGKAIVLSDLVTSQVKRRLQWHTGRVNALASAEKGEAFLSASYDGTVAIWDARSKGSKPIQTLKDATDSVTDVHSIQNGASGASIAMGSIYTSCVDGHLRTYDLRKGLLTSDDLFSPITSFAGSHDEQFVVASCLDGTIRLIEANSGKLLNTYSGFHKSSKYGIEVDILADDATVVSGSEDGTCALYDIVKGSRVQALLVNGGSPVCSVTTHPDRVPVVLTAGYDGRALVWSHDETVQG